MGDPTIEDRLEWTVSDNAKKAMRIADLERQLAERDALLKDIAIATKRERDGLSARIRDLSTNEHTRLRFCQIRLDRIRASLEADSERESRDGG